MERLRKKVCVLAALRRVEEGNGGDKHIDTAQGHFMSHAAQRNTNFMAAVLYRNHHQENTRACPIEIIN